MTYLGRPVLIQRRAPLTYALLAANILVFIALEASGGSQNPLVLLQWGAKFTPAIRAGQPWRLITAMFLHAGVLHLAVNSYSLHNLGNVVERLFGTPRFALIYLIGGVWGSLASTFMSDPRVLGVGASGAIFGLAGCLFYFGLRYPAHFRVLAGWRFIAIVLINLAIGFSSSHIDGYAHMGGLVGGFAAALALGLPAERASHIRSTARICLAIATLAAIVLAIRPIPTSTFVPVCVSSPAPASVSTAILTCSAVQVR
ncbi:MAG: rhomboid family intramembrane serine protease [Bacillota bacterium]|jgi:rhomboid protease GluP